ncbi:MAG: hypothetical protein HKN68_10160, partial [Saprospiraceae bacterium]|nr:hypothetical protein [Saprospiraceae bacterium]
MDRGGQYEVIGIPQGALIEGKTRFENILIIEYDVVTDSGTEHYKKVITCEPGGMTEIEIEY